MRRAIAWFAENSVAANLLMVLMIVGGLVTLPSIKLEVFPEITAELVTVTVPYLGAAPEEVEEGVCIRIEEALEGIEGIKRISSNANEGIGVVTAELHTGADEGKALDDIKNRVDAIDTFPEETEKPIIQQLTIRRDVINVAVSGDADERTLKVLGQRVRDEIAALPGITYVELSTARPYEISVEVSEEAMQRHGLTFDAVANAVRRSSLDLPGGSIKAAGGEILLRTKGQAYRGAEFESLVLHTRPDGTRLTLGDVARVVDGFEETDQAARFDGKPVVLIDVYRVGDQSALQVSSAVKRYVAQARARMPEGITLTTWKDEAQILQSRLNTLYRNGRGGFLLVFAVLALLLRLRLAFFVSLGIPLSFLGAFFLLPMFDISINVISLFAFILVLGILVDDAIVVGENVYRHQGLMPDRLRAAVEGTQQVAIPVIFGVLTTVAAFVPMLLMPGSFGQIFGVISVVVIVCLAFSLIESQLVLPAHLGHGLSVSGDRLSNPVSRAWKRIQGSVADGLEAFIQRRYRPALAAALEWRYLTVTTAVALLLLSLGMVVGGHIKFTFFPKVEGDNVVALLTMPQGTPVEVTSQAVAHIERAAEQVRSELEAEHGTLVLHVLATVGEQPFRSGERHGPPGVAASSASGAHLAEVNLELIPAEERDITSQDVETRWRVLVGSIPDAVELTYVSALFDPGEPINVELQGPDVATLRWAAGEMRQRLAEYPGVYDIADSFRGGKQELKLEILPAAETLGLTLADLARQVRQAFYGEEAQRIQRGRDDVRVMVRYPRDERRSVGDLENMRIRTPAGGEVPFTSVARGAWGRGFSTIRRADKQRIINVTANVDAKRANANEILADLRTTVLPAIRAQHPEISYSLEGEQRHQREALSGLASGYVIALFLIYALLAIPLRSYLQPFIIMLAIPFGLIGAVVGHLIMRFEFSMMSVIGLVALGGVVVNSGLVLVDYINRERRGGARLVEAVREASVVRFRPILLTSLTTYVGLFPLMLEESMQAQVLVPMAISIAYGVIFSAAISLVMTPCAYLILEDVKDLVRGRRRPVRVAEEAAPRAPRPLPAPPSRTALRRVGPDPGADSAGR